MPHLVAMARAVSMLSPVTMRTVMPARWQSRMASGTSSRRGSSIPTSPTTESFSSMAARGTSPFTCMEVCQSDGSSRAVMQIVRSPRFANAEITLLISSRMEAVNGTSFPSSFTYFSQRARTISAAPLQYAVERPEESVTTVVMRLRSEENEYTLRPGWSSGNFSRIFSYGKPRALLMMSSAHSVSLPQYVKPLPPGGGALRKVLKRVLMTAACDSTSFTWGILAATASILSKVLLAAHTRTTVIFDVVSVPVLSLQIVVAPPMVSQALKCRTRFWSRNIFLTEKARAMVTARGRPSGTATTKIVIPVITKPRSSLQWTWWSHASKQHLALWKA
mmetsp:Transcript_21596/g.43794  ORF Transcript_21596/g.43794 Transcript_21596/m.43794 type:complete len:334 (+) Transcript_21596:320-1321(+)